MKQTLFFFALVGALVAQVLLLGINGLTVLSIPITLFLGLNVLEKLTEPEEQPNK